MNLESKKKSIVIPHFSPADFPSRPLFRFYLVTEYLFIFSLIAHFLLLVLFLSTGVYPMALFNLVSVGIFSVSFILSNKRYHYTAFSLGTAEIVVHSFMSVFFLGLGPGFHLFLLTLGPCVFLLPFEKNLIKWILMVLPLVGFILLSIFFSAYKAPYAYPANVEEFFFTVNIIVVVFSLSLLSYYLSRASWAAETYISYLSKVDPLTGCLNRRGINEAIRNEVIHNSVSNTTFGILMCDIDDFKKLNDSYGHAFGDEILKETVSRMNDALRLTDKIGRWGGEEFLVMLPGTDIGGAERASAKVLQAVADTPYYIDGRSVYLSMSIGVSALNHHEGLGSCIEKADEAMYAGKLGGKNRVVVSSR